MADLISRAEAVRALASSNGDYLDAWERLERLPAVDATPVVMAGAELTDAELIEAIRKAPITLKPAVDAAPVVHGRWIYKGRHRKSYRQYTGYDAAGEMHTIMALEESEGKEPYCSECGAQAAESFLDFCPHCGAKMDGERRDDDGADA